MLTAIAGHDTASAVVAVPAKAKDFVYISCGTWSLFGTELDEPCITEMSADMNITNEGGHARTTRFLKNIIGLWIIQETRRQFKRDGKDYSYADMEKMAREAIPMQCFIDPDDPRFTPPGNQIQRIREFCAETGQYVPQTDGEIVRCIYESLAMKYKYTFENLRKCTGKDFEAIKSTKNYCSKDCEKEICDFKLRRKKDEGRISRRKAGKLSKFVLRNSSFVLHANRHLPLSHLRLSLGIVHGIQHSAGCGGANGRVGPPGGSVVAARAGDAALPHQSDLLEHYGGGDPSGV